MTGSPLGEPWEGTGLSGTDTQCRARLAPSRGEREPLPLAYEDEPLGRVQGRVGQQRLGRRGAATQLVNDGVASINWMAGSFAASAMDTKRPSALVRLRRLARRRLDGVAPEARPGTEEALRQLLRSAPSPYEAADPAHLASYKPGFVSLPDSIDGSPNIEDILPSDDLPFLEENQKRMMASAADIPSILPEPYVDPVLKRNKKKVLHIHSGSSTQRSCLFHYGTHSALWRLFRLEERPDTHAMHCGLSAS